MRDCCIQHTSIDFRADQFRLATAGIRTFFGESGRSFLISAPCMNFGRSFTQITIKSIIVDLIFIQLFIENVLFMRKFALTNSTNNSTLPPEKLFHLQERSRRKSRVMSETSTKANRIGWNLIYSTSRSHKLCKKSRASENRSADLSNGWLFVKIKLVMAAQLPFEIARFWEKNTLPVTRFHGQFYRKHHQTSTRK